MRDFRIVSRFLGDVTPPRRVRAMLFVSVGVFLIALAASCAHLAYAYRNLRQAIQFERRNYVMEISRQTISCQQFMTKHFSEMATHYASVIDSANFSDLSDIRKHIINDNEGSLYFITSGGELYDINGKAAFLPDRSLIENLPSEGEVFQLFTTLNYAQDYWLFTTKLNPFKAGDSEFTALVYAVSADEFRDNLAISLFDGIGASYIIRNDGSVEIKPGGDALVFDGYNLYASMIHMGADKAEVDKLERQVKAQSEGSRILAIGGAEWLFSHSDVDEDSSIVIAVPLSVTASRTYDGLMATITFASMTILSVALIAMLLMVFFTYRDKQRSREAMMVAAKSDFFSKMSHDIRTPLNAVIGLELLARDCSDNPKVKEYLRQSSASANYLLSIINDVLDMTRIEQGKLTLTKLPFNMKDLLSDVNVIVSAMAKEKGLHFSVKQDEGLSEGYQGDQVRIKQILINLLSNAIKFTPSGGGIALEIARAGDESGVDSLSFIVSDTGIGMSKEYLKHIFTPFEQEQSSYTQQYAGSGLGLAIVYNLVTMMDGEILVDSEEGEGSRFTVNISLKRCEIQERAKEAPRLELPKYGGRNVLLAEDNEINRQIASAILTSKFGLTTYSAVNGGQAVDMFAASEVGFYDMVLMDVKMPVLDGLEATRRIRALPREDAATIPIVALSANAFEEDIALSVDAGMNDYLAKPIDITALAETLRKHIK